MIHFDYLTSAYVQTGAYTLQKYYRQGQHFLQRVGDIVGDGVVNTLVGPVTGGAAATTTVYTYQITGLGGTMTVDYTITPSAATTAVSNTVDVKVNGTIQASHTIPVNTTAAQVYSDTVIAATGATITIDVANGESTVTLDASDITTARLDQPFPDFQLDWAYLSTGQDNLLGYDPGAYGIGLGVSKETIVVPVVKPVHLLYYYSEDSTDEQRHLVQVDATGTDGTAYTNDLVTPGIVSGTQTAPVRIVWTEDEYIDKWHYAGFHRFGDNIFPKGMQYSNVNELNSFTGTFTDVNNVSATYTAYFDPIYFRNAWPMFDYIYMVDGFRAHLDPNVTNISGWLLRYRGEFPSEKMAPINREGTALAVKGGYRYYWNGTTLVELSSTGSDILIENGVHYSNADPYNVTGYTRH